MIVELFVAFLKTGFVSFGGGYAVIPTIQYEVASHGWLTKGQFEDVVALAGMAPGPIATNAATLVGYESAGIGGAIASTLGMVLPSLIIVVLLSSLFLRFHKSMWVKSSLYGLRPTIAGLIVYAAIHFGFMDDQEAFSWMTVSSLIIIAGSILMLLRYRRHPLTVIVAAGVAGIVFY